MSVVKNTASKLSNDSSELDFLLFTSILSSSSLNISPDFFRCIRIPLWTKKIANFAKTKNDPKTLVYGWINFWHFFVMKNWIPNQNSSYKKLDFCANVFVRITPTCSIVKAKKVKTILFCSSFFTIMHRPNGPIYSRFWSK